MITKITTKGHQKCKKSPSERILIINTGANGKMKTVKLSMRSDNVGIFSCLT